MSPRSITAVAALLALVAGCAFAQTPASDPRALSYAAQAVSAITGGVSITDVTLEGSVIWNGTDTGTVTLKALGSAESRTDLVLSNGTRTDIRDAQTGIRKGRWINPDSSSGQYASHNCQTDAVWFFPVLSSLAGGSNVVFSYIGQETWNSAQVQHIQSYIYLTPQVAVSGGGPTAQQLSTVDFYLDATTLLPVSSVFNVHPDRNSNQNLVVEVDFSNYQALSGMTVPLRIQKSVQGALSVDITITSASFNTGLSLSDFQIN